jgi:xanthine permease XanP
MSRRPPDLIYGVDDDPPFATNLLLGLQHVFKITINLVMPVMIVRSMGGTPRQATFMVSMSMLAAGIGTMLQALNRRGVGSGYLCPMVCGSSYLHASLAAASMGGLPLVFGMTSVAGFFQVLLSRVVHRLRVLFPPEVSGVVVAMIGISAIPIAFPNFLGRDATDSVTDMSELIVAVISLGTMVGISIWSRGRMRLYPVLAGVVVGYIFSVALGLLDVHHLDLFTRAPFVSVPSLDYFGWSFSLALVFPFLLAMTGDALKSVSEIATCQKINDVDWKRTDMKNVRGGIFAEGLAVIFSGLVGGMGQSISGSSIGMAIGTGATSRKIAFAIGGLLVVSAFVPKAAMIFVVMPKPVIGAILIYSLSFLITTGFEIIMSRMLDARRMFLVGIPMILGISVDVFPALYEGVPLFLKPVFHSSLSLAVALVILLNLLFRIGVEERRRLVLKPGVDDTDSIFSFMEKQGAAWGARKEVIDRAMSALSELFEAVASSGLAKGDLEVDVRFDESRLDVEALYRGAPLEFPSSRPSPEDLLESGAAAAGFSGFMIKQYADSVKLDEKDGECRIRLHFDH